MNKINKANFIVNFCFNDTKSFFKDTDKYKFHEK